MAMHWKIKIFDLRNGSCAVAADAGVAVDAGPLDNVTDDCIAAFSASGPIMSSYYILPRSSLDCIAGYCAWQ